MKKIVAGSIGILLILASLQLQPARSTIGGPICYVPMDYATITAAVAVPGCTTIIVAAGTYAAPAETFPIIINRNLTLQGAGAATTTIDVTGIFVDVIDVNNATVNISGFTIIVVTSTHGGLYYHGGASGVIANNTITGTGTTGIFNDSSSPMIANNRISWIFYGIRNQNSSNPTIVNNIITHSMAGIDNSNSSPTITNNTITRNPGGGITNTNSSNPTITNNIIVGFTASGIYADGTSNPTNTYNDVWNYGLGTLYSGTSGGIGSISADPLYVGGLMGSDFHLQAISPAVNAGNNGAAGIPATDMDGYPRISCGRVDMGAYEIQCFVPSQYEKEIPSILPLANTNISKGNNLAKQADDLLTQAKSKNLDTATCEKMIKEAKELLVKAKKVSANSIYANNLALEAMKKLRQAIDCLKALLG